MSNRYQIVYRNRSSQPITVWRDSREAALDFAAKFRRVGYAVDVWEHSSSGSRLISSSSDNIMRIFGAKAQNG